jgi:glycosyltransferase involved in cell wall biosynthesis
MNTMLTICIPTYNRSAELYETLCAFLPQVSKYSIEICVSDNSENEETEQMVMAFASKYPYIRYHRNSSNVGMERNFCAAIAMAQSNYAWLFGDDDLPLSDAVETIYGQLIYEPAAVLLNYCVMTMDMKPTKNKYPVGIIEDRWYSEPDQFLKDLAGHSTFIGTFVVRKTLWDLVNKERYQDTGFNNVGILLEMLLQTGARALFLARPLIAYRLGNASWYANYMTLLFQGWPKMIQLLPADYSQSAKEIAVFSISCRYMNLRALLRLRMNGYLNIGTFRELVLPFWLERTHRYGCAGRLLLMAAICLFIPPICIRFSWQMYRFLNRLNQ